MPLRPLQLPQDFQAISAMIARLSEDENWGVTQEDIQDLLGMFWVLRHTWDIMTPLRWLSPYLRDSLQGFVWEMEHDIVGLALYDRGWKSDVWRLILLGVLPSFRKRGIATRLVDAVIRDVRLRGGSRILLEVAGKSQSARRLFESMGFEIYAGEIIYEYALPYPPPKVPLPEDYTLSPISYYASEPRYQLAARVVPAHTQRFENIRRQDFARNRLWWGLRWLNLRIRGITETEFVIRTSSNGQIVARGGYAIRSRWGAISEIAMRVDPAHNIVIPFLFHKLVDDTQRLSRRRRLEMIVPVWQPAIIDYAEQVGFMRVDEYYKMGIILREDIRTAPYKDAPPLPTSSQSMLPSSTNAQNHPAAEQD